MEVAPLRATELSAFVAARFAMVPELIVLPPVKLLTILRVSELATEDAALDAARWAYLLTVLDLCSDAFCAARSSFWRCFSAAAPAYRPCITRRKN